jgi:hypothetical protein
MIQLDNQGELTRGKESDRELVTTARSVIVELNHEDAPININTNKRSIGSLNENDPREVPFQVEIPEDTEPGTYDLEIDIDYDYTSRVQQLPGRVNDQTQRSSSENHEIEIKISDDARFRVTNVSSDLRVGEDGEVTGEIENIGGEDATNAEVRFPTDAENLFPQETAVAVGDIDAGESAEFRIPIEIGSEAEAVPKRFDLPVSFRDENGIRQTDDDPEFLADIGPERDTFGVEAVNRTITAGSGTTFEVTSGSISRRPAPRRRKPTR